MRTKSLFLIISVIVLIAFGCKKNEDNGKAPVLPKASSFLMDFSKLSDTVPANSGDTTTINYNYAVQKLSSWKDLVSNTIQIPVEGFLESYYHTPQYLSDGWWSWKSRIVVNKNSYNFDLRGKTTDSNVIWEGYASQDHGFNSFKWFVGECDLFTNVGKWYVKDNPYDDNLILQIDWVNYYVGNANIKYTKLSQIDSLSGSYVSYARNQNNSYNSNYKIFDINPDYLSEINLDRSSETGQIQDSLFFPDNNFHCWDSLKLDLNCN